jgi:hypothetical protein
VAHHHRTRRTARVVEQYWPFIAYALVTVTTGAYVVAQLVRTV